MKKIKYDIFIKGKLVYLVCLNEELVEKTEWYNWFNDEENMQYMQKHYFPNTRAEQLKFYRNEIENNKKKLQLGIVDKKDEYLIGVISLNNIDFLNRRCEISGFIGERKYHNFNLFIEANKIIIKHAFDNLNMHKIYGGTILKEIALMYCRVLGFKEEGIKKSEIYKKAKYNDIYIIGLLKEEYYDKI